MREATATPSEVRPAPTLQSTVRQEMKTRRDVTMATGSTTEISQDPSSETEMVNYSSGEDEPGIINIVVNSSYKPCEKIIHEVEVKCLVIYRTSQVAMDITRRVLLIIIVIRRE